MNRPQPYEVIPYQQKYIDTVTDDVIAELESQADSFSDFLKSIPEEKHNFAYADGKWTLKELLGHIIDTERIMAYRVLRFSRNDTTPLPGFDENKYVEHCNFSSQNFDKLIEEFKAVRISNLYLFKSLTESQLTLQGISNGNPQSVRALLFVIAGHVNHHKMIIKDRYLSA